MRFMLDAAAEAAQHTAANRRGRLIEQLSDGTWQVAYRGGVILVPASGDDWAPNMWINLSNSADGLWVNSESAWPGT